MMSQPKRCFHAVPMCSGSASPAETQRRSRCEPASRVHFGSARIAAKLVGPLQKMVGCSRRRMSNTAGGVGRPSNSTAVAPTDIGNDRLLPSP